DTMFPREADDAVQVLTPMPGHRRIRDIVCEGMLEHVSLFGMAMLFMNQLERTQLAKELKASQLAGIVQGLRHLSRCLQQGPRHLTPDHRRSLEETSRAAWEPLDAGLKHILDGVGNLGRIVHEGRSAQLLEEEGIAFGPP